MDITGDQAGHVDPRVAERAQRFIELHRQPGAFVIPNPWDPGTARLFELLGFSALATTGAGFAFSIGRADGTTLRAVPALPAWVRSTGLRSSLEFEGESGAIGTHADARPTESGVAGSTEGTAQGVPLSAATPIAATDAAGEFPFDIGDVGAEVFEETSHR